MSTGVTSEMLDSFPKALNMKVFTKPPDSADEKTVELVRNWMNSCKPYFGRAEQIVLPETLDALYDKSNNEVRASYEAIRDLRRPGALEMCFTVAKMGLSGTNIFLTNEHRTKLFDEHLKEWALTVCEPATDAPEDAAMPSAQDAEINALVEKAVAKALAPLTARVNTLQEALDSFGPSIKEHLGDRDNFRKLLLHFLPEQRGDART